MSANGSNGSSANAAAPNTLPGSATRDLEQAFKDLAKGEQTATAMENRLSRLESRIEELLAHAEEDGAGAQASPPNQHTDGAKEVKNE